MMSTDASVQTFDGMSFLPPTEFALVETMFSWRAPVRQELQDPRMIQGILNKRLTIQPNLIVHRRLAKSGASLEEIVGEACAELLQSMGPLDNFEKRAFAFADQTEGYLLSFNCPATKSETLRQYHVYRIDDGRLTSLALTVDALQCSKEQEALYLKSLASICKET